ncbi:MAG: fluoride efflux transporter CrcB [Streptosporangiales bacterium]
MLAVIALGGAVGSSARYLVGLLVPTHPGAFDWATFAVNTSGCLLLGAFMTFATEVWRPHKHVRPFLGVGVLGGYTTFSTVTAGTLGLAEHGDLVLANSYLVDTMLAGLMAVWFGAILARLVSRRPIRRSRRHHRAERSVDAATHGGQR